MTTIAYRDGILAADTRAYSGHTNWVGVKSKIFELSDGMMVGISTPNPGYSAELMDWVVSGFEMDRYPILADRTFSMIVVYPNGQVSVFIDNHTDIGFLSNDFFAIGSGECYALGAMAAGASAIEAVKIGCDMDPFTAGPVEALCMPDIDRTEIMEMLEAVNG